MKRSKKYIQLFESAASMTARSSIKIKIVIIEFRTALTDPTHCFFLLQISTSS